MRTETKKLMLSTVTTLTQGHFNTGLGTDLKIAELARSDGDAVKHRGGAKFDTSESDGLLRKLLGVDWGYLGLICAKAWHRFTPTSGTTAHLIKHWPVGTFDSCNPDRTADNLISRIGLLELEFNFRININTRIGISHQDILKRT